jgi:hypothetical protein
MKLQTAARKRAKIKLGLQGPSGSGKTYSSLLIAYGLCGSWDKIAVVDTENHSAELYAHLGPFNVIPFNAPHTPERYMEAIDTCVKAGMEVVILDSTTHEWDNLIDFHGSMTGNSFTNWAKVTPRHNAFVKKVLQAPVHVICTMRTKQDYVLTDKNGRMVPEKVGLKAVQRDGLDYEFTLVMDLDIRNHATVSKDRTGLFFGKPAFTPSVETGQLISQWCNSGQALQPDELSARIQECKTIADLLDLYHQSPEYQKPLKREFEQQKKRLLIDEEVKAQLSTATSLNGSE